MGEATRIEWCDHTFNPVWGCEKISPACKHCYAAALDRRWSPLDGHWGPGSTRRTFGDAHWAEPLKWNRKAEKAGKRARVFCASMADVFEDHLDWLEPRRKLWALIRETPHLDWLLLTKRPENLRRFLPWAVAPGHQRFWPNVWLGVTAENQEEAEARIPLLLATPGVLHFVSVEPMLGPVTLDFELDRPRFSRLEWVICGGESGAGARPMRPEWARDLRDECVDFELEFFFKQWGSHGSELTRIGKKAAGRELDGREWNEVPRLARLELSL